MPKLSVVVPVYQDQLSIARNHAVLRTKLAEFEDLFTFEVLLVNDGSADSSLLELEKIHAAFPAETGVVNLLTNVGQLAAVTAGLARCSGDCAVVISSDLQDPPELIPQMFRIWQSGASAVIGVREGRHDTLFTRASSQVFYRLMRRYAVRNLPQNGFDFFLLDRRVIDRLLASSERNAFIQGQILAAAPGFVTIPYERRPRLSGASGWTLGRKLKYFVDGFVAYSFVPLRLVSVAGLILLVLGFLSLLLTLLAKMIWSVRFESWMVITIVLLLLHGLELLALGIVGEYVWRALDAVRSRPLYTVDYFKPPVHTAE